MYFPNSELFFYPDPYTPDGVLDFMPWLGGEQVEISGDATLEFDSPVVADWRYNSHEYPTWVNGEVALLGNWLAQANIQCSIATLPTPPAPRPTTRRNSKPLWTVTYFN